jgi:hypothetical protein
MSSKSKGKGTSKHRAIDGHLRHTQEASPSRRYMRGTVGSCATDYQARAFGIPLLVSEGTPSRLSTCGWPTCPTCPMRRSPVRPALAEKVKMPDGG